MGRRQPKPVERSPTPQNRRMSQRKRKPRKHFDYVELEIDSASTIRGHAETKSDYLTPENGSEYEDQTQEESEEMLEEQVRSKVRMIKVVSTDCASGTSNLIIERIIVKCSR